MLLTYDDDGPGPVVVLLHGFPLDRTIWHAQRTSIGSMYRVIAPDLRGFGHTAAPESGYTMDAMAGDVVELLDALQITEPIVLGGLSMGGYVALELYRRAPELVRGLALCDTRATPDGQAQRDAREAYARTTLERGLPFVFATGYGERGLPERYRDRPTVQKPFEQEMLSRILARVFPKGGAN